MDGLLFSLWVGASLCFGLWCVVALLRAGAESLAGFLVGALGGEASAESVPAELGASPGKNPAGGQQ